MAIHVIKAYIQIGQHFSELLPPDQMCGTRRIELLLYLVKVRVILHIFSNRVRKFRRAFLIVQNVFTLRLESCRLLVNNVEGI